MAEALFPVVQLPELTTAGQMYDRTYKRSVKWDREKGDFVRDGANRMVECDGREAFATGCYKASMTERYRCLAYPNAIGAEMERAMAEDDEKTVESMVQRTITEALMANPRTEYVRDFDFAWEGDRMSCTFTVKGLDWDEPFMIAI